MKRVNQGVIRTTPRGCGEACSNKTDLHVLVRAAGTYIFCLSCYFKYKKSGKQGPLPLAPCEACKGGALEDCGWVCGVHYKLWMAEYGKV